jgi:hypothetical protein
MLIIIFSFSVQGTTEYCEYELINKEIAWLISLD